MPRYQKRIGLASCNISNLNTTAAKKTVEDITASTTLDASDSGKIFTLSHATSVIAVTLPSAGALGAGWSATFIFGLLSTEIHTVGLASEANINGYVADPVTATPAPVIALNSSLVNFTATAVVGDQFTLTSDGTVLYLTGSQQTAAAISVTA